MAAEIVKRAIMGLRPQIVLCRESAERDIPVSAWRGVCPIHDTDACLFSFVPAELAVEEAQRLVSLARDETWPPPSARGPF